MGKKVVEMNLPGSRYQVGDTIYVVINKQGTVERHSKIKTFAPLKLAFLQFFGKCKSLPEVREFLQKNKAVKKINDYTHLLRIVEQTLYPWRVGKFTPLPQQKKSPPLYLTHEQAYKAFCLGYLEHDYVEIEGVRFARKCILMSSEGMQYFYAWMLAHGIRVYDSELGI